jgi:autotransporter-associated beta strand protein
MKQTNRFMRILLGAAIVASSGLAASGQTVTWNSTSSGSGPVDGVGTWNSANTNWWNGTSNQAWVAGNTAWFGNGGTPGTVTVSGSLNAGGITFGPYAGSNGYLLTGGTLGMTGGASILLSGSSTIDSRLIAANLSVSRRAGETTAAALTLGGSNALTGSLTIGSDATLRVNSATAIGGTSGVPVTVNAGGAIDLTVATTSTFNNAFSGAGTLVKSNLGRVTLNGTTSSFGGIALNAGLLTISPTSTSTFSLGSISRAVGSGLSLQPGAGTITVSNTTPLSNGIIGPWASTGTGTNTTYATHSAGTIAAYTPTGTAATVAALPNDATANVVLQSVGGTMPSTVRANTIRYTGTAGNTAFLSNGSFTVNGLMNSGTGEWRLQTSGTLTMGSTELVLTTGSGQITFNGVSIRETTPGSSVTFNSQGGNLSLGGVAGFTGDINFNGGTQLFMNAHSGTIRNISMGPGATSMNFNTASGPLTISGSVSGPQLFTKNNTNTLTVSGTNYYTGATAIQNGTLEITTLPAIGTPGSLGNPLASSGTIAIGSTTNTGVLRYVGSSNSTTDRAINMAGTTGGATLDASGAGSLVFTSNFAAGGAGAKTLTLTGTSTAANAIGGAIIDNSPANPTSLTKAGAGRWILSGSNAYTGATTVSAGSLFVNGSIASAVSVASNGTLGGSGLIASSIGGDGRIGPGNSPGILTATSITPGTLIFDFEFTDVGSPNYANASASINDVLRLTGTSPFAAPLTSANVVNVYFDMASVGAGSFVGGFFTDQTTDFLSSISGATFNYFVRDGGGATTYNGTNYAPFTNGVTVTTVSSGPSFDGGAVVGRVTQFVVVPEPGSLAMLAVGLGIAGASAWRRGGPGSQRKRKA